jgi:hypothetical protein
MVSANAVLKHFIKVHEVGIGKILDKHCWVAISYFQHCNREAA